MFTVSANAATVIKGLVAESDQPARAGLWIGADGDSALSAQIVTAPHPGDVVFEENGARLYLDGRVTPHLSNRQLDALVDREQVRFILRDST
jgi:iron-sulfur cluster assembly protein